MPCFSMGVAPIKAAGFSEGELRAESMSRGEGAPPRMGPPLYGVLLFCVWGILFQTLAPLPQALF